MNLKGQRFGRWLVVGPVETRGKKKYWYCRCDCGNERFVNQSNLLVGCTKSCGCLRAEITGNRARTHGMTGTPTYVIWQRMKQRCDYEGAINYERYGERGISVCDRWANSFENFLDDMGKVPSSEYSIERIDNEGDYTPENCCWATPTEQARNTRRNRMIEHNGEIHPLVEWSHITGLKRTTIARRLDHGWSAEEALTTPVLRKKAHDK